MAPRPEALRGYGDVLEPPGGTGKASLIVRENEARVSGRAQTEESSVIPEKQLKLWEQRPEKTGFGPDDCQTFEKHILNSLNQVESAPGTSASQFWHEEC